MKNTHSDTIVIPILSDVHSSKELMSILGTADKDTQFDFRPNDQATRSGLPLEDPNVLAALISGGMSVLATLIALLGTIWMVRQQQKQATKETTIHIHLESETFQKLQQQSSNGSLPLPPQCLAEESETLILDPVTAAVFTEPDNPYESLMAEIDPEVVKYISILEED